MERFCYKFYRKLHWYHNYCSEMQRFSKVTFSYQPVNYLEFKLQIIRKSKAKTNVILMESINSPKTIIFANKISKYMLELFNLKL